MRKLVQSVGVAIILSAVVYAFVQEVRQARDSSNAGIREQGRQAALHEIPSTANPYVSYPRDAVLWLEGYMEVKPVVKYEVCR